MPLVGRGIWRIGLGRDRGDRIEAFERGVELALRRGQIDDDRPVVIALAAHDERALRRRIAVGRIDVERARRAAQLGRVAIGIHAAAR